MQKITKKKKQKTRCRRVSLRAYDSRIKINDQFSMESKSVSFDQNDQYKDYAQYLINEFRFNRWEQNDDDK